MNEREKKSAKRLEKLTLGKLLWDFLETRRSGRADATVQNRRGTIAWVEFKALEAWPSRAGTCPMKGKFEPGQLAYLRERISWNGRAYVLLNVGQEWLLLSPMVSLEEIPMKDFKSVAAIAVGLENVLTTLEQL